jgi:polysaccharide biosynthesis protein PslH
MKILIVSSIPTDPLDAGNKARLVTLIQHLQSEHHDVHLAHIQTLAFDGDAMAKRVGTGKLHLLPFLPQPPRLRLVPRLGRILGRGLKADAAFLWPLDSWYNVQINDLLAGLQEKHQFDVVFVTYVFMSKAFEAFPDKCFRVLDTHDRFGLRHRDFLKAGLRPRWFSTSLEEEERGFRRAHVVVAIQPTEADEFRVRLGGEPPWVANVGHLIAPAEPAPEGTRLAAVFLGSSNPINVQGLEFFIDRVLPQIRRSHSGFELVVAGAVADEIELRPGVTKLGYVTTLREAFGSAMVFVNVVLMGTGVNIKLLDALAVGMPCVSTESGARGLDKYRMAMLVVPDDEPEAFAAAVESLLTNRDLRVQFRHAGLNAAEQWNAEQGRALRVVMERAADHGRNPR